MSEVRFDLTAESISERPDAWFPHLVTKEVIDEEIVRLLDIAQSSTGYRSASVVHPSAVEPGLGFAPGIDVTINVLAPGESTVPVRRNANVIELCLAGEGVVEASVAHEVGKWDVWTVPGMDTVRYHNRSNAPWVRLTYSNAPLLRKLGSYVAEVGSDVEGKDLVGDTVPEAVRQTFRMENAPDFKIGDDGARLRGYEYLTDIQVVESKPLVWPWEEVEPHLPIRPGGNHRNIWLLYNPATERRQGTSSSFFATWGGFAPGTPPFTGTRGHRHNSASINYHIMGSGKSIVDGIEVGWKEGDLLFSAPAWREHAHYHGTDGVIALTIQDHPTQIGLGSLLWQEDMEGPIFVLGSQEGQKGWTGPREVGA